MDFWIGSSLLKFNEMLFVLCNTSATFERLIEIILQETCLMYMEDLVIDSQSFEVHMIYIEKILNKMKNTDLKLNFKT